MNANLALKKVKYCCVFRQIKIVHTPKKKKKIHSSPERDTVGKGSPERDTVGKGAPGLKKELDETRGGFWDFGLILGHFFAKITGHITVVH